VRGRSRHAWSCYRPCSHRQPAIGYTFSTIVQNSCSGTKSMMFFRRAYCCRGFMVVRGHEVWAQYVGEGCADDILRIVRDIC